MRKSEIVKGLDLIIKTDIRHTENSVFYKCEHPVFQ